RSLQSLKDGSIGSATRFRGERDRIDAERGHQFVRFLAVRKRRLDARGAAVGDPQPAAGTKFIALRVSAEVVVVVENQDSRGRDPRAIEVRRRQAADAAA